MIGSELLEKFISPKADELFSALYGEDELEAARQRYRRLVEKFMPDEEQRIFSVPGRTELGGNHTDHNSGKVLAASIHLDAVAVVTPSQDRQIILRSTGYRDINVDLSDLTPRDEEKGKTGALIRGVASEFAARGVSVGGFTINADSRVLTGSGLSSSAAVEVLFAKIIDNLYAGGKMSALEMAKISQKAENIYFGKPCGLMDQTACASGGVVSIDFADTKNPQVRNINFDPAAFGIALCIIDTRGSHADLTPDYAAIPDEMKAVAAFFGKTVLRDLNEETFLAADLTRLRKSTGDRAVLRAMHFFSENRRVDAMLKTLEEKAMDKFLNLVNESGDSSWQLLQNIYSPRNPSVQGLGLALAMTKTFLKQNQGACRVHGGGFAGTIQAYIPIERLEDYRKKMEAVFGEGALTILKVRPIGATELDFSH